MVSEILDIAKKFSNLPINEDWCFSNTRSVQQWTHGYHRYPAKFLPDLVRKLINNYSNENDIVADLFAGCGTTLVEAKIHGRKSIGVDVNPVAELITKAKTTPIFPQLLEDAFVDLQEEMKVYDPNVLNNHVFHDKIDYWFVLENKQKIAFLCQKIHKIPNQEVQSFFLVALSNILKNCSKWLQSSTKPQIDPHKKVIDPFSSFVNQSKQMIKHNNIFFNKLSYDGFINLPCEISLEDARKTSIESSSIGIIISSPPYATSYEYADIHQLTGFWYDYFSDLKGFRKKFIGSFFSNHDDVYTYSHLGQEIINQLFEKHPRTAKEIANYFNDLRKVTQEMHRILKPSGYVCLVIGNTTLLDVKVKSAEVLTENLISCGFEIKDIIKRSIPHKLIPTIRDIKTGKFTKLVSPTSKMVYPEEYIIIAQKK